MVRLKMCLVAGLLCGTCAAAAGEQVSVAVMDLKAQAGIEAPKVLSLTDLVCTEIARMGYTVIGRDDLQAMLAHIADKQLLSCDDTKCLAQVGGALGVQQIVSGNIGMLGTTYLINLKVIDIDNAVVISRLSEEYTGDESGLIGKMRELTRTVFGQTASVVQAPAPLPAPPVKEDKPPFPDQVGWAVYWVRTGIRAPAADSMREDAAPGFMSVGTVLKMKVTKFLQVRAGVVKPLLTYRYTLPVKYRAATDPAGAFNRSGLIRYDIRSEGVGLPVGLTVSQRLGRRVALGIDAGIELLFINGQGTMVLDDFGGEVIKNFYEEDGAQLTPLFSTRIGIEIYLLPRLSLETMYGFSQCVWSRNYSYSWVDEYIATDDGPDSPKKWEEINLGGRSYSVGLTYFFK